MNELELHPAAPEMIDRLDSAVAEVFDLMLGKTCLPVHATASFTPSLTVTISLSGPLEGTCLLSLSKPAAWRAMQAMLGEEGCDAMLEDTARELCNVIVGSWKSKLPPTQASALLSLPIASYGGNLVNRKKRLYSFEGNLLALALSIRKGERSYLTTD